MTYARTMQHCAACNTPLIGDFYTLEGRAEAFCGACIASRPRCYTCGLPVSEQHWQLHDGTLRCAVCHQTAVYDMARAQQLFDETVRSLEQSLGLRLGVGVQFGMADAPSLRQLHTAHTPGERVFGLYRRHDSRRTVTLLYGLPLLVFRATAAHEYAHAWENEHCPLLDRDDIREGFAEWVAYRHLLAIGASKAAARMRTAPHPYQPLLAAVLAREAAAGPAQVIQDMYALGRGLPAGMLQ